MNIKKALTVYLTEGELEVRMGRAMTSVYLKGQEKMVLYTREVDTLIELLNKGKEELATFVAAIKADEVEEPKPKTEKKV